jgi:hypothetical protein
MPMLRKALILAVDAFVILTLLRTVLSVAAKLMGI